MSYLLIIPEQASGNFDEFHLFKLGETHSDKKSDTEYFVEFYFDYKG